MDTSPHITPYEKLGSHAGVQKLVKAFYDLVENDPEGAPLLSMHLKGHGLAHARVAQVEFLSGFLGGPPLYFEHHRNANVRTIHAHLEIGAVERDAWLVCMDKALTEVEITPDTHKLLMTHFSRIAEVLRTKL